MKRLLWFLALFTLATQAVFAADLVNADRQTKVALQAYDPVAFFSDSAATKGNPLIAADHNGYTYLFATEAHKAEFMASPDKFLPAYGGYCAFGVSIGKLFPVQIDTWEIIDGRLVLQYSQDIKKKFAEEKSANLKKAEANWPKLVASEKK